MAALMAVSAGISLHAADKPQVTLKANRTLVFNKVPPKVDSLKDMLTEGMFYGRIRINTFKWDWKTETSKSQDNWAAGFGGSLLYKSAEFKGFSGMAGLYTSQSPWHMNNDDVKYIKAGKDTTSRYGVDTTGDWGMTVLAQAYLQYRLNKTKVRVGRQIFESFLTKSNDTKMIPNTFEGFTVVSKDLPKTTLKAAYITRQKLRDHTRFHDVITFKDVDGTKWANNDDSAINKSLTYQNFVAAGMDTEHDLIVLEAINKSVKNLKLKANYTTVPDIVSSATVEAYYTIPAGGLKIIPGVRYMKQFDEGVGDKFAAISTGAVSVANLKGKTTGYTNPNSLDSWLFAAKVDIKSNQAWKFRLGYSKIADKADIVAPWRGFPTGGFTRAMAQYNWYANTKTYMIRGDYSFDKAGLVPGLTAMFRYAIQDFDDNKPGVQADTHVIHLDAIQKIKSFPGLEARVRIGIASGDPQTGAVTKADPSYKEYRFELNYLF
ncbi:MAG TPA: outer membrane porin, OprD family [Sulfurimonas sp.]|nr:outer membrane porin, OprD family [Sulfurimonas sp.]